MRIFSANASALEKETNLFYAGAICKIKTNSAALVATLESLVSSAAALELDMPVLTMDFLVNEETGSAEAVPYFRGQHHLAVASFGPANIFIFDALRRHLSGTITTTVAQDAVFWEDKMLPIAIGVMGASIGVLPMHSACLSFGGAGVLIAGASGAGKSTLSAELCRAGTGLAFEYISDDWTYITVQQKKVHAHGVGSAIKLRPDAINHFPVLQQKRTGISMNGELAYEVKPKSTFGAHVERQCMPRWLFFLERKRDAGIEFTPLTGDFTRHYLEHNVERLPPQMSDVVVRRAGLMDAVAELPCWQLRYGGTPAFAAAEIRKFITALQQEVAQ